MPAECLLSADDAACGLLPGPERRRLKTLVHELISVRQPAWIRPQLQRVRSVPAPSLAHSGRGSAASASLPHPLHPIAPGRTHSRAAPHHGTLAGSGAAAELGGQQQRSPGLPRVDQQAGVGAPGDSWSSCCKVGTPGRPGPRSWAVPSSGCTGGDGWNRSPLRSCLVVVQLRLCVSCPRAGSSRWPGPHRRMPLQPRRAQPCSRVGTLHHTPTVCPPCPAGASSPARTRRRDGREVPPPTKMQVALKAMHCAGPCEWAGRHQHSHARTLRGVRC